MPTTKTGTSAVQVVGEVPIDNLTDSQLRIEIAEWCGWTVRTLGDCVKYHVSPDGKFGVDSTGNTIKPPNYPNDLNAMWEAEEKLLRNQERYSEYNLALDNTVVADTVKNGWYFIAHATARQRAIAFVKTIRETK